MICRHFFQHYTVLLTETYLNPRIERLSVCASEVLFSAKYDLVDARSDQLLSFG